MKEPKVSTETELQDQQQKVNLVNEEENEKPVSETTNKQVPDPSPPEIVEEVFTAERLFEYQWPPDRSGEFYLLQEDAGRTILYLTHRTKRSTLAGSFICGKLVQRAAEGNTVIQRSST